MTPPSLPDSSASTSVAEPPPGCGRTRPLCAPDGRLCGSTTEDRGRV